MDPTQVNSNEVNTAYEVHTAYEETTAIRVINQCVVPHSRIVIFTGLGCCIFHRILTIFFIVAENFLTTDDLLPLLVCNNVVNMFCMQ